MTNRGLLGVLRERGEGVLQDLSAELLQNPRFLKALQKALQKAMQGKEALDAAAGRALKKANIPTRTEFKKSVKKVEALEREVAELKTQIAELSKPRKKRAGKASRTKT